MLLDSREFEKLMANRIKERFTTEEIQNFLGFVIKASRLDEGVQLYNLYDEDGKLLLANKPDFLIRNSMDMIMFWVFKKLYSEAEQDDENAVQKAQNAEEEFKRAEEERKKLEQKDWVQCDVCGKLHEKGTHWHVR